LLLPDNLGVALYLKSVGLLSILADDGVSIDDQGISGTPNPGEQLVLPIRSLGAESEVDTVANEVLDRLQDSNIGSTNLYPVVSEVFAELALNAVQHSDSSIAAFGLIQFYQSESGRRFICAVADGGIGIRASLERNPGLRRRVPYEWTAIDLALEEGVSGTGSPSRGIGLFGVSDEMSRPGRQLIIHSGNGLLIAGGTSTQTQATRCAVPFPGTLTLASIPA
jgi:anti-sigma regulatory factor (Ser/Thr protein kinase)